MDELLDIFIGIIEQKQVSPHRNNNIADAKLYRSIYSGKDQADFITQYRVKESLTQKDQRKRITLTKTKHVAGQIDTCLDLLQTFDKAAKIIEGGNDAIKLKDYIYQNNIEKVCYEHVKYYNLTDANAYLICGKNKYDDIVFTPVRSENVLFSYVVNDNLRYLVIQRKTNSITSYTMYTNKSILIIEDIRTGSYKSELLKKIGQNNYYVTSIATNKNYAFRLGYKKSVETNFETCDSFLSPASELFKCLMWEGSELDVIKATHGMIQKFAYAQRCNHNFVDNGIYKSCQNGMLTNCEKPTTCNNCNGTGLKTHTSSQDIIFIEEPMDGTNSIPLANQIHVEYIPDSILEYRKNELLEIEEKIFKTVFSSNYLTKSETAATATEKRIDQQGLYSALGKLGKQVSECFIWAAECIIDIMEWKDVEVFHGYSLDLKLDTLDTLIEKRTKAQLSGVPIEVINVLDYAILQKQNVDNPKVLEKMAAWEIFKPFSEKTSTEKSSIIAGLQNTDPMKVLWIYFGSIKQQIIGEIGDEFYKFDYEKQKATIDDKVNKIIESIKENQSLKIDFND
jgi:hypothetical protein